MPTTINHAALSGVKLLFRGSAAGPYQSGSIQEYSAEHDCFVVWSQGSNQYGALSFKQFVVEQALDGQLVLRVPACMEKPLPAQYQAYAGALPGGFGSSSHTSSSSITPQASAQLSTCLSQQLSGLIGRCFSHTEDGFEVAGLEQQQQPALPVQVQRQSRHSTDSADGGGSYWGSPVKHDGSAAQAAAGQLAAAAAAASDPASLQLHSAGIVSAAAPPRQQQPLASGADTILAQQQAAAAAAAVQQVGLSSFQEISRMIAHSNDGSPLARPGSIKTSVPPGLAARLLDEQGSWGTPQENSPWGTPREQQMGSNTSNTPTSGNAGDAAAAAGGQHHGHHHSGGGGGQALHKLMFGCEQLHSRLEAVSGQQQQQQLAQDSSSAPPQPGMLVAPSPADMVLGAAASKLGKSTAAAAACDGELGASLEPAALVAAAVAAVDAAAAMDAEAAAAGGAGVDAMDLDIGAGGGDMDFTIPTAMDVQPRPHSRSSSRVRDMMYRAGSGSNTAMNVDMPQPLSARTSNLMRSPGRSLPAPSDPGLHSATAVPSAFTHAASLSAVQLTATGGGAFEQRRTSHANIGASGGLSSYGGSHAASRRISRNASSRLNADQDWALLGPDGQSTLQQQLNAMQQAAAAAAAGGAAAAPQQRASLGQVMPHGSTPAVTSRRASRTLSGRLALDQDIAAVLMEQLDDAEPDVLSRPLAPAAPGLDTIISRRQSTSNGRGTPDSDGFGFSEFEGLEPLVPPEEAAAAAISEAAAAAAAAEAVAADGSGSAAGAAGGAGGPLGHHHRAHRRSARSLGVPAAAAMTHQRPTMRLSDQDPGHHGLAALPAATAAAVAAAAAARAHASAAASAGIPGNPRVASYDVVGAPAAGAQGEAASAEQHMSEAAQVGGGDGSAGEAAAAAAGPLAAAHGSRLSSRSNSTGVAAGGGSPGGQSAGRSASGSLNNSRRSSKRSIPSLFQAAAAVAAAAEAAVGFALGGGRDRTHSGGQQQVVQEEAAAKAAAAAGDGPSAAAVGEQQGPEPMDTEQLQLQEASLTANSFLRQRLRGGGDGGGLGSAMGSVDSFTCPPFMPLSGSITVTAASTPAPGLGSADGAGRGSSNGGGGSSSGGGIPIPGATEQQHQGGGIPIPPHAAAMAAAAAAALAADGDTAMDSAYGSPAANLNSGFAGSPSAVAAALLRRQQQQQQLVGSEGSEWGSGALLSAHMQLCTSGIDSPTGSAVWRLGGDNNSPQPQQQADADFADPMQSVQQMAATATNTCCSTGGTKAAGIGASRMGREAAAAAGGLQYSNGPVGAAALLLGTQGSQQQPAAAVFGGPKGGIAAGLSEITPALDDEELLGDPGEGRIRSAKYPSDSGSGQQQQQQQQPGAGAVFFSLAESGTLSPRLGGLAVASAQMGVLLQEQQQQQDSRSSSSSDSDSDSSSGGGAAVSRVLGKIAIGTAAPLPLRVLGGGGGRNLQGTAQQRDLGAAAAPGAALAPHSSSSSNDSTPPLPPPSYAETVGGGMHASRSVHEASSASSIRPSAGLGGQQQDSASALSAPSAETAGDAAGADNSGGVAEAAQQPASSTGLVRRTPHASRTPSQSLPAGVRGALSIEGLGLLGGASFNYGDECDVAAGAVASSAWVDGQGASGVLRGVALHAFLTLSAQWYDSMALVVLAPQLAGALLPPDMPQLQQLQAVFGIYALGHVLALLGCFVWPWRAAKLAGQQGHKGALAWTVGVPAFCTALQGCMPSHAEGGMAGIVIMALLCFLSGAAASNTAPAALAYLSQHAPQCPNLHAAVVPASMAAGALGASGLALVLSWVMLPAVLAAWGWRVVLVCSLVSNAVSGGLRGWVLQDHPQAQRMQGAELADRSNVHVGHVLRTHAPQLLLAVLLQAFAASGLFLLTAWLPSYFMQLVGMPTSTMLLIHTISLAALAGSMLLGGLLADEWDAISVLLATCVTAVAWSYPAWLLFSLGVPEVTCFCSCVLCVLVGLHWGALSEVLLDMFPPGMRCSALTLAHTLPMVALGSTAPLFAGAFVARTGSLASPAFVSIIAAATAGAVALALASKLHAVNRRL